MTDYSDSDDEFDNEVINYQNNGGLYAENWQILFSVIFLFVSHY